MQNIKVQMVVFEFQLFRNYRLHRRKLFYAVCSQPPCSSSNEGPVVQLNGFQGSNVINGVMTKAKEQKSKSEQLWLTAMD